MSEKSLVTLLVPNLLPEESLRLEEVKPAVIRVVQRWLFLEKAGIQSQGFIPLENMHVATKNNECEGVFDIASLLEEEVSWSKACQSFFFGSR